MRHQNNIRTLFDDYGLEYEGKYRRSADTEKLCAKFTKADKVIWRNIYKSNGDEYIKYDGRKFFFD
jgi:hypothetical protein